MDFTVIDVETANPNLASICQVGIAVFRDGQLHETWSSFVNPNDYFHPMNVFVHGIDEFIVRTAPSWADVYDQILPFMTGQIVASHMPFDRVATLKACQGTGLEHFDCLWLDTAKVARRVWSEFSKSGYGLKNLASHFDITFEHHDALEDARAAGEILLRALAHTGSTPEQLYSLVNQPLTPALRVIKGDAVKQNAVLSGNVVVFTGELSICRRDAAEMAAESGCEVGTTVTKKTTLLVVGDQDIDRLAGKDKSLKHIKAESLIAQGQKIRILGESDFQALLRPI